MFRREIGKGAEGDAEAALAFVGIQDVANGACEIGKPRPSTLPISDAGRPQPGTKRGRQGDLFASRRLRSIQRASDLARPFHTVVRRSRLDLLIGWQLGQGHKKWYAIKIDRKSGVVLLWLG